jgi:hypothetical protein
MRHGAHAFLTYAVPEMNQLILENITAADAERLNLRHEIARKSLQRRLHKISRTFFSGILSSEQKAAIEVQIKRMLRLSGRAGRSFLRKNRT